MTSMIYSNARTRKREALHSVRMARKFPHCCGRWTYEGRPAIAQHNPAVLHSLLAEHRIEVGDGWDESSTTPMKFIISLPLMGTTLTLHFSCGANIRY
ncbi:hypothetical protein BH09GEM1_BH09GEM1_48170 [soil metagenome]